MGVSRCTVDIVVQDEELLRRARRQQPIQRAWDGWTACVCRRKHLEACCRKASLARAIHAKRRALVLWADQARQAAARAAAASATARRRLGMHALQRRGGGLKLKAVVDFKSS